MKVKTYISTEWIEVHNYGSRYMAKVFLTDDDQAYMILATEDRMRFFMVKAKLLRLGEIGFFEKVLEEADELPLKQALEMGLISELDVVTNRKRQ